MVLTKDKKEALKDWVHSVGAEVALNSLQADQTATLKEQDEHFTQAAECGERLNLLTESERFINSLKKFGLDKIQI